MGMHLENGATPFVPDLVWFYCEKSAERGSETTVCDGAAAIDLLPSDVREVLTRRPIVFSRTVPEALWRTMAARTSGVDPAEATLDNLKAVADDSEALELCLNADGSLSYRLSVPVIRTSRISGKVALAHSIFGPSYNYDAPVIAFADGESIPAEITQAMSEAIDQCTADIAWKSGDFAVLDNTRVMHGRREILDSSRRIFNAQSYL
jgi:alpha-ketoglutarate-dependent taurine dioxygenase